VEGILSYKKVFWITKFSIIWQKVKSIEKEKEFFHLNGLGVSYNQDTRDNILNPEKGAFVFLYSNLYGAFFGGTENLVKFGFDLTRFNKIRTYIFAVRFMGGSIVPYGRTREVPYLERFLVGGEGTIRGIARFSVGEYDIRGIKSGTNFFIFNLEFRKKILTNFQFIIFSDIGTAGNTFSSEILKNMAMGFGFGIRYFLGILPLRIDIGTNPEEINYKKIYLYLGIGQAF
jgi:translocation and assembly module TamA